MKLKEKLLEIREELNQAPSFWGLRPCIAEKTLQAYEEKIGIRLPEEYREFLLHVSNGADQPYLGMYSLEQTLGYLREKDLPALSEPFPFEEEYHIESYEEYHRHTFDNYHVKGALFICNYGCGIDFLLVLTGEHRGEIWFADEGNSGHLFALYSEDGHKHNFLTWFEEYCKCGDLVSL